MNLVDVVITFHIKDKHNLNYTVNSIRKYIPFLDIYIITKYDNLDIVEELNCKFVNEAVIGEYLYNSFLNEQRGGWFLQQVLKLYAYKFVSTPNYLVMDADTVVLRKLEFFEDNQPLYLINENIFQPYFKGIDFLLGINNNLNYSFISHHMIFNKEVVKQLINDIEFHTKTNWINAIRNILNKNDEEISFSEFEIYGNFMVKKDILFSFRSLRSIDIPIKPSIFFIKLYSCKYDLISFHNYSWNNNNIFYRFAKKIKYFFIFLFNKL